MTSLSDDELQESLQKQMPGFRLVRRESQMSADGGIDRAADAPVSRGAAPDAETPSIESLKQKYLGRRGGASGGAARALGSQRAASRALPETELIIAEPEHAADAFDRGAGPKALLVSEDGTIVGKQG